MKASSFLLALAALGFLSPVAAADTCFRDCEDILCAARCWSTGKEDGEESVNEAHDQGRVKPELPICPHLGGLALRDLTVPFAERTYFVKGVGACAPDSRP